MENLKERIEAGLWGNRREDKAIINASLAIQVAVDYARSRGKEIDSVVIDGQTFDNINSALWVYGQHLPEFNFMRSWTTGRAIVYDDGKTKIHVSADHFGNFGEGRFVWVEEKRDRGFKGLIRYLQGKNQTTYNLEPMLNAE